MTRNRELAVTRTVTPPSLAAGDGHVVVLTPAERKYFAHKRRFFKQYRRVVRETLRIYWLWVEFENEDECPPPDGYPFGSDSIDEVALKLVEYTDTLKVWEGEGD